MKSSLNQLSIRVKLILVILAVSSASLVFSFLTFFIYDFFSFRTETIRATEKFAALVGTESMGAVDFAQGLPLDWIQMEFYEPLSSESSVVYGAIFDRNEKILTYYDRQLTGFSTQDSIPYNRNAEMALLDSEFYPQSLPEGTAFSLLANKLDVYHEIYKDERIGTVFLRVDLDSFYQRYLRYVLIFAFIFIMAILLILAISTKLQAIISKPILQLADTTKEISTNRDYSIRMVQNREDEIGTLIGGFNGMLAEIERQNKELVDAKDAAEQSAKAKEQFLANMSHEIRTPMNGVLGMADLLAQSNLNSQQRSHLEIIMSSADNLLVIIDDILDFTKIESGKMELEEQLVVLPKVTHAIIESCRPKFEKKSIEVKLNIEPNVPTHFLGDKTRLHQILLNLFNNAIKFTQKGSITIGVQLLEELEKSVHLRFYVADTGIGIPKEKVEQIFSPFTQASSDTTRKFGGTGLGLSISRQLVELHGGNMYLDSEVGKGSTFSFEIRYNKNLEPIPTKTATPPKNGTAPALPSLKQNGIKPKILLAEDNEVNQMLMMQLLSQWDIETELAKNGKQAIELLKNQDFSLILMDVHMPELDGYGATKYIRAHFPMPKRAIPIIAITASALKGEAEKCQAAGMDDYISKPVKKELLYQKIADNVQATQLHKK